MSNFSKERREKSYIKLSHLFNNFRAILNPHLDVSTLAELGVDVSFIDLHEETARGGPYYLPISQSRLQNFHKRPLFDPGFSLEDDPWNYHDGCTLLDGFAEQMVRSREGTASRAIREKKWYLKPERSTIERKLHESGTIGFTSDPTRQCDWSLSAIFQTTTLPHQICLSIHHLPDVQGPIRSEMMIITAIIIDRMKRKRFQDQEIFPLLMLSVMGRNARVIQAHMCLSEQRLKVRYTQLLDLSYYTPVQIDLFVRWLMSDPLSETKPIPDGTERPRNPAGDTAPQLTAFQVAESQSIIRHCGNLQGDFAAMSIRVMVPVA